MDRITTTVELSSGEHATAVVSRRAILVAIDDRACLAHHRWFDRDEAAEMIAQLRVFVGEVPPPVPSGPARMGQ